MNLHDHPDYLAFVAAIRNDPDNDALRLIAADRIDELGFEEYAEFIRVQVEYEQIGRGAFGTWRFSAQAVLANMRRQRELRRRQFDRREFPLDVPGLAWNYCLLDDPSPNNAPCAWFHRGFLDVLECQAAHWLTHADAILAAHPIREVTLTTWPTIMHPIGSRASTLLATEWHGIKFNLPTHVPKAGVK